MGKTFTVLSHTHSYDLYTRSNQLHPQITTISDTFFALQFFFHLGYVVVWFYIFFLASFLHAMRSIVVRSERLHWQFVRMFCRVYLSTRNWIIVYMWRRCDSIFQSMSSRFLMFFPHIEDEKKIRMGCFSVRLDNHRICTKKARKHSKIYDIHRHTYTNEHKLIHVAIFWLDWITLLENSLIAFLYPYFTLFH